MPGSSATSPVTSPRAPRAATALPSMIWRHRRGSSCAGALLAAARSPPSACARERSLAKRTTTSPPGSTPTTTPSPNWACTTSSPSAKTAPPPVRLGRAPGAAPPPQRGGAPRGPVGLLLTLGELIGISSMKRLRRFQSRPPNKRARARVA